MAYSPSGSHGVWSETTRSAQVAKGRKGPAPFSLQGMMEGAGLASIHGQLPGAPGLRAILHSGITETLH